MICGRPDTADFTSWQYAQPGNNDRVAPLKVPICASGPNVAVLKKTRRSKSSPLPNCVRKPASFFSTKPFMSAGFSFNARFKYCLGKLRINADTKSTLPCGSINCGVSGSNCSEWQTRQFFSNATGFMNAPAASG